REEPPLGNSLRRDEHRGRGELVGSPVNDLDRGGLAQDRDAARTSRKPAADGLEKREEVAVESRPGTVQPADLGRGAPGSDERERPETQLARIVAPQEETEQDAGGRGGERPARTQATSGKPAHSSPTVFRTDSSTPASPSPSSARAMQSAIASISDGPMP